MFISFTLIQSASAEDARKGCLVKTKDKILLDPDCKCLEKKLCATPGKIVYKEENFTSFIEISIETLKTKMSDHLPVIKIILLNTKTHKYN